MNQLPKRKAVSESPGSIDLPGIDEKQSRDALEGLQRERAELEVESSKIEAKRDRIKQQRLDVEKELVLIMGTDERFGNNNDLVEAAAQNNDVPISILMGILELLEEENRLNLLIISVTQKYLDIQDNIINIMKEQRDNLAARLQVAKKIRAERKN